MMSSVNSCYVVNYICTYLGLCNISILLPTVQYWGMWYKHCKQFSHSNSIICVIYHTYVLQSIIVYFKKIVQTTVIDAHKFILIKWFSYQMLLQLLNKWHTCLLMLCSIYYSVKQCNNHIGNNCDPLCYNNHSALFSTLL